MRHTKFAPMDPETEINRPGIMALSGASHSKVIFVSSSDKWGFPQTIRRGTNGELLYPKAAAIEWLKENDLKAMVFLAEDRRPNKDVAKETKMLRGLNAKELTVGSKKREFSGHGKTITVHVPERHEYQPPDPRITRFSNSGADHRISSACGWQ